VTGEWTPLWWALGAIAAFVVLLLMVIWRKGRPFAPGDVFRASRLSAGNHLFPTQVLITPTTVVQHNLDGSGGRKRPFTWRTSRR
jgi:hypothetical protein